MALHESGKKIGEFIQEGMEWSTKDQLPDTKHRLSMELLNALAAWEGLWDAREQATRTVERQMETSDEEGTFVPEVRPEVPPMMANTITKDLLESAYDVLIDEAYLRVDEATTKLRTYKAQHRE